MPQFRTEQQGDAPHVVRARELAGPSDPTEAARVAIRGASRGTRALYGRPGLRAVEDWLRRIGAADAEAIIGGLSEDARWAERCQDVADFVREVKDEWGS